jgi:hypothetical protein
MKSRRVIIYLPPFARRFPARSSFREQRGELPFAILVGCEPVVNAQPSLEYDPRNVATLPALALENCLVYLQDVGDGIDGSPQATRAKNIHNIRQFFP